MGNIVATLKRFISNKNTVTILAVLAGVIILWYFYNYRVNQAITTVRVPYAVERIDTTRKIESDNIEYREITRSTLNDNDIVTDINQLQDKYVCMGTSIPANGFFHTSQVCEETDLPSSVLQGIPDGYTAFDLPVTANTTYANSIAPGDYIDLYIIVRDRENDNKILFGKLIESIEVLVVRDSSNRDVFWDQAAGDSAHLLFAVPDDYFKLLMVAQQITGLTIRPVPRNGSYTQEPGQTQISSQDLYSYIINQSVILGDEG